MPEFYEGVGCGYQPAAQPYLDAIARGVRDDSASRAFLLQGTQYARDFAGATALWAEQSRERNPMEGPFWSNYFYQPCRSCTCRVDTSVAMEIDAIFFLQNHEAKRIAVHIEMKRAREPLSFGQAEAYRPRAECYRDQRRVRRGILAHDYFVTVLICDIGTDIQFVAQHFDRVIFHQDARNAFSGYPS